MMSLKAPTHRPDSNQQPAAFIQPLCCLLSDLFSRKVALNAPLRRAASAIVACTFCACMRCNKGVALHEKRKWWNRVHQKNKAHTVFRPSHKLRWFTGTPPIRMVIQLANNQSEYPMAQTSDSQPPQTLHVESEKTTSELLRKLPTLLNTPNIFVPNHIQVSPNTSDVQRLGRCVPALRCSGIYSCTSTFSTLYYTLLHFRDKYCSRLQSNYRWCMNAANVIVMYNLKTDNEHIKYDALLTTLTLNQPTVLKK